MIIWRAVHWRSHNIDNVIDKSSFIIDSFETIAFGLWIRADFKVNSLSHWNIKVGKDIVLYVHLVKVVSVWKLGVKMNIRIEDYDTGYVRYN